LQQFAMGPQAKEMVPYVPRLLQVISSGELAAIPGMDAQVFQILRYVAQADPGGVFDHIDAIYVSATNTANADAMLAMCLDEVGRAPKPGAGVKCMQMLCDLLSDKCCKPGSVVLILG
jgi:hypothetical protein